MKAQIKWLSHFFPEKWSLIYNTVLYWKNRPEKNSYQEGLSFRSLPTSSPAALGIGVALQGRKRGLSAVLGRAGTLTNKACSISPPAHWRTQVYQFVDKYKCQSNWLLQIDLGIEDLCCKLVPPQRFDSLSNWLRFKCWKCHYHLKTKMIQENMHANK